MEFDFKGKRALVTGASRGIGRDIAIALAKGGAVTYGLGRTKSQLDALEKEVPGLIHGVAVDATDWNSTKSAVEKILEDGPIDLLVNNAGTFIGEAAGNITEDACQKSYQLNVFTAINLSQIVSKSLIAAGKPGSIVNISSQAAQMALTDHIVYCGTKAALDATTRGFAKELGPHKIRVNSVLPTVIMTEMGKLGWSAPEKRDPMIARIPLGSFAEVKDVVHPVLYLLSDKSDMISGITMPVDGGALAN